MFVLAAGSQTGHRGQPTKRRFGCVNEAKCGPWVALSYVLGPLIQIE
jgi:hypothetical protein